MESTWGVTAAWGLTIGSKVMFTMALSWWSAAAAWGLTIGSQVLVTLSHTWPFLVVGALVAAALKPALDQRHVGRWLRRHRRGAVVTATALAVATPLCSCGTFAVVIGMLSATVPWAPIVAFLVASPLTSPTELVYSAGLFGWPFALTFLGASVVLGLMGGAAAAVAEERGWLEGQARLAGRATPGRPLPVAAEPSTRFSLNGFGREFASVGLRLLGLFLAFSFLGYGLNGLLPESWIPSLFGGGHAWSVPLAATVGLPLYVNTDASLPLVRAFLDGGAGPGAVLAFLITGAGTSFGALAGALTIARWRVIGLVVGTLWVGAVLFGWGYGMVA